MKIAFGVVVLIIIGLITYSISWVRNDKFSDQILGFLGRLALTYAVLGIAAGVLWLFLEFAIFIRNILQWFLEAIFFTSLW
jgi:hypothetical protein